MKLTRIAVLAASCLLSTVAISQTRISYYAPGIDGHGVPAICLTEGTELQRVLADYPHPADWTYIVACDDHAWGIALRHLGITGDDGQHYGETNFSNDVRTTYLRGSVLNGDSLGRHVVVHELAHIYLNSKEERKVERLAGQWLKDDLVAKK